MLWLTDLVIFDFGMPDPVSYVAAYASMVFEFVLLWPFNVSTFRLQEERAHVSGIQEERAEKGLQKQREEKSVIRSRGIHDEQAAGFADMQMQETFIEI